MNANVFLLNMLHNAYIICISLANSINVHISAVSIPLKVKWDMTFILVECIFFENVFIINEIKELEELAFLKNLPL